MLFKNHNGNEHSYVEGYKSFVNIETYLIQVLSGGVSSNLFLRQRINDLCAHYGVELVCPPPQFCTDNGVMIAW